MFFGGHILQSDFSKGVLEVTLVLRFDHLHGKMPATLRVLNQKYRAESARPYGGDLLEVLKGVALHYVIADLAHLGVQGVLILHLLKPLCGDKINGEEHLHGRLRDLVRPDLHVLEVALPLERQSGESNFTLGVILHHVALLGRRHLNLELVVCDLRNLVEEVVLRFKYISR